MGILMNIFYAFYFWLFLLLNLIFLGIPYLLLRLLRQKEAARQLAAWGASFWARHILSVARIRVEVEGLEHLPCQDKLCFISNHQSYVDIAVLLGYIPRKIGFIAKAELRKIPLLSLAMKALGCVFIKRRNRRQSIAAIQQGVHNIGEGISMVIFPEGTRSKSPQPGPFMVGSLKVATLAKAVVVPVTINGTYRVFEKEKRVLPGQVKLTVHPSINTAEMTTQEQKELPGRLKKIITSALDTE